MKVFRVRCDVNKFQGLLWDAKDPMEFPYPDFDGTPINRANWPPGEVVSLYPKRPKPDIWTLDQGSGAFACNQHSSDLLDMFLEMAGELLPLPFDGETLTVLNILVCLDCLDKNLSEWKQMKTSGNNLLVKPCIRSDRLTASTLFKSSHDLTQIFCWEKDSDPEYEFKACVESNKLAGLLFEEVLVS